MYPEERVQWWSELTKLQGHQTTYNNIANSISGKWRIFLDVGCGTGEILKRVYQQHPNKIYIGIDSSEKMIELAAENLHQEKIPFQIKIKLKKISASLEGKVLLVKDDITCSKIPSNFSDITLFSFPEVFSENDLPSAAKQNLIVTSCDKFNEMPSNDQARKLGFFAEVVKKTKINGRFISVE